jgi:hypothetical protein
MIVPIPPVPAKPHVGRVVRESTVTDLRPAILSIVTIAVGIAIPRRSSPTPLIVAVAASIAIPFLHGPAIVVLSLCADAKGRYQRHRQDRENS